MSILKSTLFGFAISFNLNVLAADPNNTTEQRDKNLERRHSGETMEMRDCLIKTSNDKVLCEKELLKDSANANATGNDTPRRQQNTNSRILDDIKTKNSNPTDVQSPNGQLNDLPIIEPLPDNGNTRSKLPNTSGTGDTGTQ